MVRTHKLVYVLLSLTCLVMVMPVRMLSKSAPSRECIGLGEVCSTAAALQAFNLRQATYPFDWIISRSPSLLATLQQDFCFFLAEPYLYLRGDNHGVINRDGLEFVHDFPTINYVGANPAKEDLIVETVLRADWKQYLADIQKKYARRIERFRERCTSNKKIYFIRHFGTSHRDAIEIRNSIKKMYPNLDFTLVIVGNNGAFAHQWGEENIRNYYLNDTVVWNDVAEWKRIFEDLGLLTDTRCSLDIYAQRYQEALCGQCSYCKNSKRPEFWNKK
jgi:hypothetical protein